MHLGFVTLVCSALPDVLFVPSMNLSFHPSLSFLVQVQVRFFPPKYAWGFSSNLNMALYTGKVIRFQICIDHVGRYSPTFTLFSWLWVQMITDKLFIIRSTQFQGLYAHYLVCSWGFRPGPCKEQFKGSTRIWAGARRFLHGPDAKLFRQINIWHISTHLRVFHYPPSMLELHKC